jgi:aryl-alcohol dehydrogenase-like predicted oxidoreductase
MTRAGLDRQRRIVVSELGRTGLHVSQAGFGGYRISAGVAEHAAALQHALVSGINLIDTRPNYADGGSEELVGQLLAHMVDSGELRRDAVVVVSKAGYLQGKNYTLSQERKRLGRPFPELVPYADGLEHWHPPRVPREPADAGARTPETRNNRRLSAAQPRVLPGMAAHKGLDPSAAQIENNQRIANAFRHLETEVTRGRIRWYGLCRRHPDGACNARCSKEQEGFLAEASPVAVMPYFVLAPPFVFCSDTRPKNRLTLKTSDRRRNTP